MLAVKDLAAGYGATQILHGIDLSVGETEIVAVLGSNGAGKSTLNRTISGVLRARRGSIRFADVAIERERAAAIVALGLVHVPEGRRIFPNMTVRENLQLGAYRRGKPNRVANLERVFGIFPRLKERHAQRAGTLSGGEQQMLAIGRGIASSPRLLLLDEPSMGLAPAIADLIFDSIAALHREDRVTLLLVEQRVAEALESCDYGYVLETGRVVLEGTHRTLTADDRVRRAYLGM
ncbi:MAG: ABC transporter ATP-binding protein [Alphaproteobacteria bacterium]|nr:ABC transporter ATP-binding protein [Alphaproteobacteria bacterium]